MSKEILAKMIQLPSPSGFEDMLQEFIASTYKTKDNTFEVLEKGELTAIYNKKSNFSIMLASHADEISLIVDGYNEDGTLNVSKNGGVRLKLYIGCQVLIISNDRSYCYGVMGIKGGVMNKADVEVEDLFVDCGFNSAEEAIQMVPLGSYVIHNSYMQELGNDLITGRALDDRVGDYVIHEAAKKAISLGCKNKILVTTTTGEENTGRGAYQAVEHYKPNIFVAVDVTYATDFPGSDDRGHVELNQGGVICEGSIPNRQLNKLLKECANELNLPIQYEVFSGRTGTDADTAIKSSFAPATVLYSIPLRYMHSPSEVVSFKDVENMIDVLALFLTKLSSDTNLLPYNINE